MKPILSILGVVSISGASFVASSATSGLVNFDVAKTPPPSHHQSLHEQAVGDNPFISKNTSFPKNTNIGTIYQTYNGTIYVSALHGLYQSTDGNTFTKNTSFPKNTNIGTIYQTYNGTIYASTLHDLYQSTDGNTFTKNTSFPTDAVVDKIFQAKNGTIYVGLDLGLYQSTDGTTFTKNTSFPATTSIDSIFQAANGTIYVGTDAVGLYQSTNGTTFTKNPSLSSLPKYTSIDTINQSTNGTIYILTNYVSASKDSSVLYQSTDGTTFTKNTSVTSSGSSYLTTIFQAKNGTIYVCPCGGLWQSTDGTTFTKNTSFPAYNTSIATILQTQNGNIYVGTVGNQSGLWQSTDGTTFTKNTSVTSLTISIAVYTIVQTQNGTIYVGTDAAGLYQFSSDLFYNLDFTNDYLNSDGYNVFATERSITLKAQYLQSASLDGNQLTVPSTTQIPVGQHKITMTVKTAYQQDAYEAGLADQNGVITLKVWVKKSVDTSLINYATASDTTLYTGLTSNKGNTNNWAIIQTAVKSGSHPASLTYSNSGSMIDYSQSYYVAGDINSDNDFTASGKKQVLSKDITIATDGIYHLHLVDYVGNTYDAVLELAKSNWEAEGNFSDADLTKQEQALKVTAEATELDVKQQLSGYLGNYQSYVVKTVSGIMQSVIKQVGGGFDYQKLIARYSGESLLTNQRKYLTASTWTVANQPDYTTLLNTQHFTSDFTALVNQAKKSDIDNGLGQVKAMADALNVKGQNNVVDESTLAGYQSFVRNYHTYMMKNDKQVADGIIDKAGLGYLTAKQITSLENLVLDTSANASNDIFKTAYIKPITWTKNTVNNDATFKAQIDTAKITEAIDGAVQKFNPTPQQQLDKDIADAEKGVNLHGNSVQAILDYKGVSLPQNKSQISNFDGKGTSFHDWLQTASNDYNKHLNNKNFITKLAGGIGGAVGGLLLIAFGVWIYFIRYRNNGAFKKKDGTWNKKHLNKTDGEIWD